ncbi:MAG: AraC family transcriptional regulator [Pseudomonadota bacterium]
MHTFEEILNDSRYRASLDWKDRIGSAGIGVSEMEWGRGRNRNLAARYSALTLYRSPSKIRHVLDGEARPTRAFAPGDLMLRPPNLDYVTEYEDPARITVFAIESDLVQSVTTAFNADVGAVFGQLEARPFRSPLVEGLASQLSSCARARGDRFYADAVTHALVHELWRIAGGAVDAAERKPTKLDAAILRRIDEAIADAPNGQVSLDGLARLAGMSSSAFAEAMRGATGLTPYKYVVSRRLKAASDMVQTTMLPLADVALRCGFASQSHMTDVFRSKLGVTPGKLRKSCA